MIRIFYAVVCTLILACSSSAMSLPIPHQKTKALSATGDYIAWHERIVDDETMQVDLPKGYKTSASQSLQPQQSL